MWQPAWHLNEHRLLICQGYYVLCFLMRHRRVIKNDPACSLEIDRPKPAEQDGGAMAWRGLIFAARCCLTRGLIFAARCCLTAGVCLQVGSPCQSFTD